MYLPYLAITLLESRHMEVYQMYTFLFIYYVVVLLEQFGV